MLAYRRLLFFVLAVAWLFFPVGTRADELYCCVCTGCPGASSTVCESVALAGLEASCVARCPLGCSAGLVMEGACDLNSAACTSPVSAPALSHAGSIAVAALLGLCGFYMVGRRIRGAGSTGVRAKGGG
jgi:hypothetical protein